jgi:septal ring factor EnvC (AmiA/AmiB activator)
MRRALDGNPPITTYHGQAGYGYFGKHAGYDYGIVKWAVRAPETGVITAVYANRPTADGGNIVEMRGAYTHRFLHLDTINVSVGQQVTEGQQLAITGNTGNVGYHLHHDVRKNGTAWTDSYANYYDWEQLIKGDTMNTEAGTENYRTALHREPESVAAASQWNGMTPAQALRSVRGTEWQIQDSKLKAYDTLQAQVAELSSRPTKAELETVVQTLNDTKNTVASLEQQLEAEKAKPPVQIPVEVIKEVEVNPSWLRKAIDFINNLLRSK